MKTLDQLTQSLNRALMAVAGFFLIAMIGLTCGNILLRIIWVPIRGTFELMGFFGAIAAAFALGYTQAKRGHIAVDILIHSFSRRTQKILHGINNLLCTLFFALLAWQLSLKATVLLKTGEVTETLRIIYYPFTYGVAFGCAVLALVFAADLANTLLNGEKEKRS